VTTVVVNGNSYSDNSAAGTRNLDNGGHREWFLPLVSDVVTVAGQAASSASAAASSATLAASLAGTAITGTSSTSLTIGTGTKVLTIETGKAFVAGMAVRIGDATAANTNYMDGTVTTYNAGTGTLTVSVSATGGSGTLSSWSVRALAANASGGAGATITASTTLTAVSDRVRPVAMTSDYQSVTLPDATTLSEGGPYPVLPNIGNRTAAVRDSTGTLLASVPPGGVAEMYLRDNSTAAGVWSVSGVGLAPAFTAYDFTWESTWTTAVEAAARLDDTLSMHFGRNSSGHPAVRALKHSTAQAGAAQLIVASNLDVAHVFRISSTKAAVIVDGTSSNVCNVTVDAGTLVSSVSTAATAAVFDAATFTGPPLICQLGANNDILVGIDTTGTTVRAQAVDCSGTNPSAGSSVNLSALGTGSVVALGCYRIDASTALAIWIDDSGSAGTPFSIRARTLSVAGNVITLNTADGLNDVTAAVSVSHCQLSSASYIVGFLDATNSDISAVHIGVSGTSVTFGAKFAVEVGTFTDAPTYTRSNANRFQPNLFPLSSTTAVFTWDNGASNDTRHAILTNSAGTLSRGDILYTVFNPSTGGNFPQASDGWLAHDRNTSNNRVIAITVNGTSLAVTGTYRATGFIPISDVNSRFGLSGGIRAIRNDSIGSESFFLLDVFRFRAGGPPLYLGQFVPNNIAATTARAWVEVAANKISWTGVVRTQSGVAPSSPTISTQIWEFAA
jgi:hypothetical protein